MQSGRVREMDHHQILIRRTIRFLNIFPCFVEELGSEFATFAGVLECILFHRNLQFDSGSITVWFMISRGWCLSPWAAFLEDGRGEAKRTGVFHRLTGVACYLDERLTGLLKSLRTKALTREELAILDGAPSLRTCFDQLINADILVTAVDPQMLLLPYLDCNLIAPVMNPAVTWRNRKMTFVIRLKETDRCDLPRTSTPPEIIEEQIPPSATRLLSAASKAVTLRQAIEKAVFNDNAKAWNALNWLTAPKRQLVRVIAPNADRENLRSSIHYPIQSLYRAAQQDHNQAGQFTATGFYENKIGDPDWNFDWVETTVSHAFRFPTAAFDGKTYGQCFAEALMQRQYRKRVDVFSVLEIGGGTGFFARDLSATLRRLLGTETRLEYTIADCSPRLIDRQRRTLRDAQVTVDFVLTDAHQLRIPERQFDLIIANEMIADLATELPQGIEQFMTALRAHRKPGGMAVLVEYEAESEPALLDHLNHPERSVDFPALEKLARDLGFKPQLCGLTDFLNVREVEMLCGQHAHYLCLNWLLAKQGRCLPYAAFSRDTFEELAGASIEVLGSGLISFALRSQGVHFGPDMNVFQVLILE